jgi:hypothetical protein
MPECGFMSVRREPDPSGRIKGSVGFLLVVLLLLRLEWETMRETDGSLNKDVVRGHLLVWISGAEKFLPASHGGEGKKRCGTSISASGRWRGRSKVGGRLKILAGSSPRPRRGCGAMSCLTSIGGSLKVSRQHPSCSLLQVVLLPEKERKVVVGGPVLAVIKYVIAFCQIFIGPSLLGLYCGFLLGSSL